MPLLSHVHHTSKLARRYHVNLIQQKIRKDFDIARDIYILPVIIAAHAADWLNWFCRNLGVKVATPPVIILWLTPAIVKNTKVGFLTSDLVAPGIWDREEPNPGCVVSSVS